MTAFAFRADHFEHAICSVASKITKSQVPHLSVTFFKHESFDHTERKLYMLLTLSRLRYASHKVPTKHTHTYYTHLPSSYEFQLCTNFNRRLIAREFKSWYAHEQQGKKKRRPDEIFSNYDISQNGKDERRKSGRKIIYNIVLGTYTCLIPT